MAKYKGIPPFTGTCYGICIYKMYDQYYLRTQSSLTGKQVKEDPRFHNSLRSADRLALASRAASQVYKSLPVQYRQHKLYRIITGQAIQYLKQGMEEAAALQQLMRQYGLLPLI